MIQDLRQRLAHYWRTLRTHRVVLLPKPPAPYIRAEVLDDTEVAAPLDYHAWYYNAGVWKSTRWQGVRALKSVSDMWNYQEIMTDLEPALIVEFGTAYGGAALFFASVLEGIRPGYRILTVDTVRSRIDRQVLEHPNIEVLTASTTSPATADAIRRLRAAHPGPVFAILDSDHSKDHVLAELQLITPLLQTDDYLVVEDSNLNGHPVLPDYGPGPYEAVEEFLDVHPDTYRRDALRERKFGFTFAPHGFLIRQ